MKMTYICKQKSRNNPSIAILNLQETKTTQIKMNNANKKTRKLSE